MPDLIRSEETQLAPAQPSLMQLIDKLASTPNLSMESVLAIKEILIMQREAEAQRRKELFDEAHRLCQMEMPRVDKNGLVTTKEGKRIYSYAKLEDLDACIREIYQRHGFSVSYDAPMALDGAKIRNVARFSCAGHTEALEITAAASNRSAGNLTLTDAQKVKQTITECRRHLLEMFFNVITVDADKPKEEPAIEQGQADDIRTRLNDLKQKEPGWLIKALCRKYGVPALEEIKVGAYDAVIADVVIEEKKRERA